MSADIKRTPEYKAARYHIFYGDFHMIVGLIVGAFGVLWAPEPSWWGILLWVLTTALLFWATRNWYTLRMMNRDTGWKR